MTKRYDVIKFRRGTAAEWTNSQPQPGGEVLRLGEPGYEKDTGKLKIGDGVTPWNSLPYLQTEDSGDVILQPEDVQDVIGADGFLVAGSGINIVYDDDNDNLTISTSGVSLEGHTHTSSDITDFNTSVSGLIPVKDIVNGTGTIVTSTSGIYSINVSASGISGEFDKISFSTTADPTIETAEIGWDTAEGTLDLGLEGGAKIHVGEHTYFRIRNNTGSILRAGQAVYASDVHNNSLIEASLYTADGSIREIRFIGLVLTDIDINQKGYAINFGHVENLDTRGNGAVNGAQNLYAADEPAWVEGDILYVHPTIPGKLTKVEPKHSISAAIVLYVHQNNGRIFVRPTSYGHLSDNHDVDLTGLADNNLLVYNSSTDNWEPSTNFIYNEDTGQTTINTEGKNNSLRLIQASDTGSPRINLVHNRGVLDTQTPLQSGDLIGSIQFNTLNSSGNNSLCAEISAYTNEGLSAYDHVPTVLRIGNRNKEGGMNYSYIFEDGTINPRYGAIINDNAKSRPFEANSRFSALQVFNVANLANNESCSATLSWCWGSINDETSTATVVGSQTSAYITVPSGVTLTNGGLIGQSVDSRRNYIGDDNGTLPSIVGQFVAYGHSVTGNGTNPTTNFAQGISIFPFAGKGTITTAYDLYLGNIVYDEVIDASGTIKEGDGSITNRYGIVQQSADPNVLSGSLTVNSGLSAPTPIFDLGTVSNNVNINYGIDRQIQKITLDGLSSINFLQGSNWPTTNHSVDVLLEINVTSPNSVLVYWDIVDEWYNEPDIFVNGKYLVLLRSMGPSVVQGHYIGKATQVTTSFITDENGDRIMAENGDFILF